MDWLVFGDDWGAHPSTTQHLVRHLPHEDRVVWVGSVGMRAPRLRLADARRIARHAFARVGGSPRAAEARGARASGRSPDRVIRPHVLPWHHRALAVSLSRRLLGRQIRAAMGALGVVGQVSALLSNPAGLNFLRDLPIERVAYLRLDDYPRLPGVDGPMIAPLDQALSERADVVFYTGRALRPAAAADRACYLPQGVDLAHFSAVAADGAREPVLGFFGLLAEWLDYDLIAAVAAAAPEWRLELLGPVRWSPPDLADLPNVTLRPAVPYSELPRAIGHWSAAWVPFRLIELTAGVNPLKLREYLAAGLPTASTPLPEVRSLEGPVRLVESAAEVVRWLRTEAIADTPAARVARRERMAEHGWDRRAQTLRSTLAAADVRGPWGRS